MFGLYYMLHLSARTWTVVVSVSELSVFSTGTGRPQYMFGECVSDG